METSEGEKTQWYPPPPAAEAVENVYSQALPAEICLFEVLCVMFMLVRASQAWTWTGGLGMRWASSLTGLAANVTLPVLVPFQWPGDPWSVHQGCPHWPVLSGVISASHFLSKCLMSLALWLMCTLEPVAPVHACATAVFEEVVSLHISLPTDATSPQQLFALLLWVSL